jgi:Spy/CpxP family protein refolding chaperone
MPDSSPNTHPNATRRWRGRFSFSLGLNAALLASLVWLVAKYPNPPAEPAPDHALPPPMMMMRPPKGEGQFPPPFVLKRIRGMALEAGVTEEQWTAIEAVLREPSPEFIEKMTAMRRSRLETLRAIISDPDADPEPVIAKAIQAHEAASLAVLNHAREIFQMLEPEQRAAALEFLDERLAEFDQPSDEE